MSYDFIFSKKELKAVIAQLSDPGLYRVTLMRCFQVSSR